MDMGEWVVGFGSRKAVGFGRGCDDSCSGLTRFQKQSALFEFNALDRQCLELHHAQGRVEQVGDAEEDSHGL